MNIQRRYKHISFDEGGWGEMIHAQTFVKSNAYYTLLLLFCLNVTCSFLFFSP